MDTALALELAPPDLPGALITFCRVLRRGGMKVGAGEIMKAVGAAELVGVSRRDDFRQALQASLVTRREELPFFEWAFGLFWQHPDGWREAAQRLERLAAQRKTPPQRHDLRHWRRDASMESAASSGDGSGRDRGPEQADEVPLYSRTEQLRFKRFAEFTDEEVQAARQMISRAAWAFGSRLTRRLEPGHRRVRLNVRKTIRNSVLQSPDLVRLVWQHRKSKPRPIVILCDISGSMERTTRMLLHFIHSLSTLSHRVESFTFGTRLTRITRLLRRRNVNEALGSVGADVKDWAGGTRIGEAMRTFNLYWARRTLGGGADVIIVSDGWDTGQPQLLEREVARLQRSCHRLIWLNPNLGHGEYQPITQGIRTVLPYVDDFLPVHNLQSLFDLGPALSRHRPPVPAGDAVWTGAAA